MRNVISAEFSRRPGRLWAGAAVIVPLAYAIFYAPYGMDTTDFGYFYGHAWRLLQGEVPYRDFSYITPPMSLLWHAFWLALTPDRISVLAGKTAFLAEMLGASWMGTLYLGRVFDLKRLDLPAPLLATLGFVWGVHSFPPMPWHTVDGLLFGSGALLCGISGFAPLAGILAGMCMLTKQSFLFVPAGAALMVCVCRGKREALYCVLGTGAVLALHWFALQRLDAWQAFRSLTTGQLDVREALESGIFIYLTQNPTLPVLALLPLVARRLSGRRALPFLLRPVPLYFCLLAVVYIYEVLKQKAWIGYGYSWPTLLMLVGGLCVLFPGVFLNDALREPDRRNGILDGNDGPTGRRAAVALGTALLLSWSTGVSGGYKIPAFGALPLLFCALLAHRRLGGGVRACAALALAAGLVMFRFGYEHPYVFPQRPMPRASLTYDAGSVYPRASGVFVDRETLDKLRELRLLRLKYGPRYKTLPAFPLAYFLNDDKPAYPAEWLMDWQIGGRVDWACRQLLERDITVFMEKDQMGVAAPDAYPTRRYSAPLRVAQTWRRVEETEHFVVLRPPGG
ncbi:MAG: hypothetical protein LBR31_07500 [Desulfovibrio sp.]|nr:hypothetical protein [Desulfovibrio sp.]